MLCELYVEVHDDISTERGSSRLALMSDEEEYGVYSETRQRRIRVVAWVVIVSLILVGGGATVFALLFG
ncbi:hypothetical protein GCM10009796_18830 [Microbacterium koreense]